MKFKITYNEADTINKTAIVEAESGQEACLIFTMEKPNAFLTKIEVAENA